MATQVTETGVGSQNKQCITMQLPQLARGHFLESM